MQADVEKASFKPIWINKEGIVLFRAEKGADTWTGELEIDDIIARVSLTKGNKLDANSKKLLKGRTLMYISDGR